MPQDPGATLTQESRLPAQGHWCGLISGWCSEAAARGCGRFPALPVWGASWPGGRAGCRSHRPALPSLSLRPHPGSGELSDSSRWPGLRPCVSCPGGQEPHCTNGALGDVRPACTAILHRPSWCSLPAFTDSQVVDLVSFVPRLAREQRQSPSVFRIPGRGLSACDFMCRITHIHPVVIGNKQDESFCLTAARREPPV